MNSNWSYSPETPNLGQIRLFFEPCDLEIWRMTLKNNRAPLLSNIKLYASFHRNMWIQTGVMIRKRLNGAMTSVTLTFDLDLLHGHHFKSLVITPENFMMIQWWEHSQKGVTDGRTDRQTDGKYHSLSCLVAAKKDKNIPLNEVNIMASDDLSMSGARASAARLLTIDLFFLRILIF